MFWPQLFKRWTAQLLFVILIHWIAIYPVDSAFQRLNNRGLFYCTDSAYSIDAISFILSVNLYACFSLAHKHKHKDIRTRRMALSTLFAIPALLNPMINKWTFRPPYCFWYARMRSGSKWPMIVARPYAYACAYIDPVFTSQSYDISIRTSTRRTNLSVFLVLILVLMSTQFSLTYIRASASAYALVKTRLYRAFSLTLPASMRLYWNKRKKRVQLPQDWFGTPTWPPFHCFGTPIWPPWCHVKTLYWNVF